MLKTTPIPPCNIRWQWNCGSLHSFTFGWRSSQLIDHPRLCGVLADFSDETKFVPIHVLGVPDDYQFMDAELVELIGRAADPIIAGHLLV